MIRTTTTDKAHAKVPSSNLILLAREAFFKLEHLQNLKDPNRQQRIVSSLRRALIKLQKPDTDKTAKLRNAFIERYQVSIGTNYVKYTLPKDSSVVDLLRDAQAISYLLRGVVAVYPPRLNAWMKSDKFTSSHVRSRTVEVVPLVRNSEFKSRNEQVKFLKEQGLKTAEDWELAGAHAIYSIFKNKELADLFAGCIVRVKGTKLYYGNGGLSEMDESDYVNNCSYKNVKMAAASRS